MCWYRFGMLSIEHYMGPQYSAAVRLRNVACYLAVALLLLAMWIFAVGLLCGTLVHFGLDISSALVVVQVMMVVGSVVIVAMLPRIKIRHRQYVGVPIFSSVASGKAPHNTLSIAPPVTPPRSVSVAC